MIDVLLGLAVVVVLLLNICVGRRFGIAGWKRERREGKYVGWIRAKREDLERLEELGVQGAMIYNETEGAFEYCEIPNLRTMRRLEKKFPGFWRSSFTKVED